MTADEFVSLLDRVRRSGAGWMARCPAHDDRNPSLKVDVGADGRVLVYCHAGCSVDAIVGALGLRRSDLFLAGHRQAARLPARPVRRADFTGAAQVVANVLYALETVREPWQTMVASDCPYCGSQGAWLTARSDGRVTVDCPQGCDDDAYVQALLGRLNGRAKGPA